MGCFGLDRAGVLPNAAPCQIMHPLLVGLGEGVEEELGLGVGLGLGNHVASSTKGMHKLPGLQNSAQHQRNSTAALGKTEKKINQ